MAEKIKRCTFCSKNLDPQGRWWKGVLPWWFCSRECAADYYGKDGETGKRPMPKRSAGKGSR